MSHRAVIGLGSNLGKREFYIRLANRLVEWEVGRVVQRSSVIETPAWGFESDPFLNQVIVVETELSPLELLDVLQGIERRLGRTQQSTVEDGKPVYHARTIDLDILDYDGENNSRGAEVSLSGDLTDNWTVLAMYAYNRYTDENIPHGRKGRTFERYPQNTLSLNTSYRFASGALEDVVIGGGYRFRLSYVTHLDLLGHRHDVLGDGLAVRKVSQHEAQPLAARGDVGSQ